MDLLYLISRRKYQRYMGRQPYHLLLINLVISLISGCCLQPMSSESDPVVYNDSFMDVAIRTGEYKALDHEPCKKCLSKDRVTKGQVLFDTTKKHVLDSLQQKYPQGTSVSALESYLVSYKANCTRTNVEGVSYMDCAYAHHQTTNWYLGCKQTQITVDTLCVNIKTSILEDVIDEHYVDVGIAVNMEDSRCSIEQQRLNDLLNESFKEQLK